jgi:hypothetical protein
VEYVHLTCSTTQELRFALRQGRRYPSFGLLYLALHGNHGGIELLDGSHLSLEELGGLMSDRFETWGVHLGTCRSVGDEPAVREMLDLTGAAVVTGYTRNVDWIDSAVMDLLLLDWAQEYSRTGPLLRKLSATYPDLIADTGFTATER